MQISAILHTDHVTIVSKWVQSGHVIVMRSEASYSKLLCLLLWTTCKVVLISKFPKLVIQKCSIDKIVRIRLLGMHSRIQQSRLGPMDEGDPRLKALKLVDMALLCVV